MKLGLNNKIHSLRTNRQTLPIQWRELSLILNRKYHSISHDQRKNWVNLQVSRTPPFKTDEIHIAQFDVSTMSAKYYVMGRSYGW